MRHGHFMHTVEISEHRGVRWTSVEFREATRKRSVDSMRRKMDIREGLRSFMKFS